MPGWGGNTLAGMNRLALLASSVISFGPVSPFPCSGTMDNDCTYTVDVSQGGVVTAINITINCDGATTAYVGTAARSTNARKSTSCVGTPGEKVSVVPSVSRWGLVSDCDDITITTPACP